MKNPETVKAVVDRPEHFIDSKKVDCRTAVSRTPAPESAPAPETEYATKKIFVGGLHYDLTPDDLKEYFGKYGAVTDCIIMKDKETGKSRGFGFVSFESEAAVEAVLVAPKEHVLMGKWIDCKRATAKAAPRPPTYGYGSYYPQTAFPMPGKAFEQISGTERGPRYPPAAYQMQMGYPMGYMQQPQPGYPYYPQYQYGAYGGPMGCKFREYLNPK